MQYLAYILGLGGWITAAIIFRYGLYPPGILFLLVTCAAAFVVGGLSQDKWAGVKLNGFVWLLIPVVYQIYPTNLLNFISLFFSFVLSLILSIVIGGVASKLNPRKTLNGLILSSLIFILLIGALYYEIEKSGQVSQVTKADAAIILGAAVWEGSTPSPSMYARVKEGVKLYQNGLVKKLLVSGGLGRIPPTEAEVMADLAVSLGVPREDILLEQQSSSTEENLKFSKIIGEREGFNTYLIVTDAFHLKRALAIAAAQDISAQGVPALESPLYTNKWLRFKYTLRETFGLIKFYLLGK